MTEMNSQGGARRPGSFGLEIAADLDSGRAVDLAELYALDTEGRSNFDGVLLTNGVLNGGTRAYQFRADLRVFVQETVQGALVIITGF